MIERTQIDGRDATVAYINAGPDGFEPADKDTASIMKIIFDDGDVMFAVRKNEELEEPDKVVKLQQRVASLREQLKGASHGDRDGITATQIPGQAGKVV